MKPNGGGTKLPGRLEKKITEDLGGLEKFKTDFAAAGVGQFGSGWCWLSVKNGKLEISKTANGESPLVHGATPILGCDVWEHSYYIDYRNRRPDYLKAFVDHLVNWDYVDELLGKVRLPRRHSGAMRSIESGISAIKFAKGGSTNCRPFLCYAFSPSFRALALAAQEPCRDVVDAGNLAMNYLLVFIGGGLGSTLRYLVNVLCPRFLGA